MASLHHVIASPLCAGLALLLLSLPPPAAAAAECSIPHDSFLFEPTLPKLVARLTAGQPVTIVAIGGASTEGRAANGPEFAWPSQLAAALGRDYEDSVITVVNLGKPRQTAAAALARFEKEVLPRAPTLVIWETGTVEAVRNADVMAFRDTLQEGISLLRPGIKLVLVDMQFSPLTRAIIDFEPYKTALRLTGDLSDVALFPRDDLMRGWSEAGEIDYSVKGKKKRQELARQVYECIGNAMAAFLTRLPVGSEAGRWSCRRRCGRRASGVAPSSRSA